MTLTHDPSTGDVNFSMVKGIQDFVMGGLWNAGTGYNKSFIDENIGTDEEATK